MEKLDLSVQNLRKFGVVTMAGALPVLALFVYLLRHKNIFGPCAVLSALFIVVGLLAPASLRPVYKLWMGFAFILGWVNTRIILVLLFYLVLTPLGILLKLFGKDLLERKISKSKSSYWIKKEPVAGSYEKQF